MRSKGMKTTRKGLIELIENNQISQTDIPKALEVSEIYPSSEKWIHFINGLFLWLGGLALAVSAMFFIAYNWSELGRFAKFGLVEILIVSAFIIYWRYTTDMLAGKVSLLVACLLVGVLMALFGQTYQTGADPWQLFFNWALLILPWVVIARFPVMWVFWIALINLSITLYYRAFPNAAVFFFFSGNTTLWSLFFFNTIVFVAWELLAKQMTWLQEGWAIRLLAVSSGVPLTLLCMFAIFDSTQSAWSALVWLICIACLYLVYRKIKPDLFMLAGGCLSGIVVIVSFFIEALGGHMGSGGFFFLAFLVIGLGTGAAVWLRNVNQELQS